MHEEQTWPEAIYVWVELLDGYLANSNVLPSERPLNICLYLVNKGIITGSLHEKNDEFINTDWFKIVYKTVEKWYKERYGEKFTQTQKSHLFSIVYIYNAAFLVKIPITLSELVHGEKYDFKLYIPNGVLNTESMLDLIDMPPNFKIMNKNSILHIENRVRIKVKTMRNIHHNLMTLDIDSSYKKMSMSVIDHLSTAAQNFIINGSNDAWSTYWPLHLAIENIFKIYLLQSKGAFEKEHDLLKLYNSSGGKQALGFSERLVRVLPSKNEVIKARYHGTNRTNLDFMICYCAGLSIIKRISSLFKRGLTLGEEACLYCRFLPFQK